MNYLIIPGIRKSTDEDKMYMIRGYFGVSHDELRSSKRSGKIIKARFLCIWFLRKDFKYTLKRIGKILNRDHSSVINALRIVSNQLSEVTGDNEWKRDYDRLK